MATSRAIKPKRDDTLLSTWESTPERAPSITREDRPTAARIIAMIGLFLLVLGTLAMLAPGWQRAAILNPGQGFFIASIGLSLILFHALVEREFQLRRMYAILGMALLSLGAITRLISFRESRVFNWPLPLTGPEVFFFYTIPALFFGLIFLAAVIRNETDAPFRTILVNIVGGAAVIMISYYLFMSLRDINHRFLPREGVTLMILGLLYACTFIGLQESNSEYSYFASLALGGVGILGIAIGVGRSLPAESTFLVPSGLFLIGISLIYLVIAMGICLDWPVIVLTRRELAAYFFSPVAYLVFAGQLICAWFMFWNFVGYIQSGRGLLEPIVVRYIFSIIPVIVQMFFIPAVTMRLLSEEKRSGTLEVLLTAPVNEISVVLGKFFSAWIFYMLLWLPWWGFLISLRYMGGEEFDYRPILSFTVALGAISTGLMAMGLFCSSLTSNQIIAAVFTFVGVMAHLACYFLEYQVAREGGVVATVLRYINFFDLWEEALEGNLAPRYLIFHLSMAIFFLFATIKVLESRKWK